MQHQLFTDLGDDVSPDGRERIEDFLSRHGGAGSLPSRRQQNSSGEWGWFEVYAADGYKLRCDWSRFGGREEIKSKFSEERACDYPPQQRSDS